jgi:hypothetical protein
VDNLKIDTIKIQNNTMIWKQIEKKAGLIFMRIVKRGRKIYDEQ